MRAKESWIVVILALAGTGACVAAVIHFFQTILHNKLEWPDEQQVRHYYLAVGNSYSQGFVVGFFLCFSLAILAIALADWRRRRRELAALAELEAELEDAEPRLRPVSPVAQ